MLIEEYHRTVEHSGPSHTWITLRKRYRITKGRCTVRKILGLYSLCKRKTTSFGTQFNVVLFLFRVYSKNPAFYVTGTDYLGPIPVKQKKSNVKRYGCIFTCLKTPVLQLEAMLLIQMTSSQLSDNSVAGEVSHTLFVLTMGQLS